ncbi:MAG: HTH domain-containing protein [Breznakibacter sp.]
MVLKLLGRLERLDYFITTQRTGTSTELARKLDISRRQLYNYFDEMKTFGLEVEYDRYAKTFRYKGNMRLKISIKAEPLSLHESRATNGGRCIQAILPRCNFIALFPPIFELAE